jgi:hypothetical protein
MENTNKLAAPCGLYYGVCGILIAHRDNNIMRKMSDHFFQKATYGFCTFFKVGLIDEERPNHEG